MRVKTAARHQTGKVDDARIFEVDRPFCRHFGRAQSQQLKEEHCQRDFEGTHSRAGEGSHQIEHLPGQSNQLA